MILRRLLLGASVLSAALAGCVSWSDGAVFHCGPGIECPPGQSCDEATQLCVASSGCVPVTCADFPAGSCGIRGDGCGILLTCGCGTDELCGADDTCSCPEPSCITPAGALCDKTVTLACGSSRDCSCEAPKRCDPDSHHCEECVPIECGSLYECGLFLDDGCGAPLDCGLCAAGESCNVSGRCVPCGSCSAGDCDDVPTDCGTLQCGDCSGGETCGGGGVPNRCGCPAISQQELCAGRCGTVQGCEGPVECGGCASGSCHPTAGVCVPELRPFCFGPSQSWDDLNAQAAWPVRGGMAIDEGGERWFYFVAGFNHWRVRVDPADGTRLLSAVEPVPTAGPPDELPLPYDRAPFVRPDGLELFYVSDLDSASDYRTYVASRGSLTDPWPAVHVELPLVPAPGSVVLLGDGRTLLYLDLVGPNGIHTARRPTATQGDTAFAYVGQHGLPFPAAWDGVFGDLAPGCDGTSVTFAHGTGVGVVDVLRVEPTELGTAVDEQVEGLASGPTAPSEAPDCQTLYFSDFSAMRFARRVPCP